MKRHDGTAPDALTSAVPATSAGGATLSIAGLRVSLGRTTILRGVALEAAAGQVLGVVGPNGAGKSTLLRCLYRGLRPDAGTVLVDGHDLLTMKDTESARQTAALPQEAAPVGGLRVRHVVSLGRSAYLRAWQAPGARDDRLVEEAMRRVGADVLAERDIGTLSGGERQRVLLARALAQQPRVLVLDEPLNHLDIRHQLETLDTLRELGITTVLAIHDLGLALRYCDRICVLDAGTVVAAGPPAEVLSPELMAEVFDVHAMVAEVGPGRHALWCEPRNRRSASSDPDAADGPK